MAILFERAYECECCGVWFWASRAARTCSTTCRMRMYRVRGSAEVSERSVPLGVGQPRVTSEQRQEGRRDESGRLWRWRERDPERRLELLLEAAARRQAQGKPIDWHTRHIDALIVELGGADGGAGRGGAALGEQQGLQGPDAEEFQVGGGG